MAALVVGAVLLTPAVLWAHARLTRSEPSAKARLEAAPTVVRLWFSEAPELAVSSVVVKDSTGAVMAVGPLERDTSKLGVRAAVLSRLAPGTYTVTWRVAAADGHPTTGTFSFTVLATAQSVVVADTVGAIHPDSGLSKPSDDARAVTPVESPRFVAVRGVQLAALLVLIGAIVFRFGVVDRSAELTPELRAALYRRLATVAMVAALFVLLADAARLELQKEILGGEPSHLVHIRILAANTEWGRAWLMQVGVAIVMGVAIWLGRRGQFAAWVAAAVGAIALAVSPALGGHAAASASSRSLAIGADALHVLAAAGWMGSLFCLVTVALPVVVAGEGDDRWRSVASLVAAFSPLALLSAAVVLLSGVVSAWLRMGALAPLWTTDYGRVLLIKLAMLAAVAATGAYNWRRVQPTLGTAPATSRLRKTATTELALGAAVVIVTAILVAMPTPLDLSR